VEEYLSGNSDAFVSRERFYTVVTYAKNVNKEDRVYASHNEKMFGTEHECKRKLIEKYLGDPKSENYGGRGYFIKQITEELAA